MARYWAEAEARHFFSDISNHIQNFEIPETKEAVTNHFNEILKSLCETANKAKKGTEEKRNASFLHKALVREVFGIYSISQSSLNIEDEGFVENSKLIPLYLNFEELRKCLHDLHNHTELSIVEQNLKAMKAPYLFIIMKLKQLASVKHYTFMEKMFQGLRIFCSKKFSTVAGLTGVGGVGASAVAGTVGATAAAGTVGAAAAAGTVGVAAATGTLGPAAVVGMVGLGTAASTENFWSALSIFFPVLTSVCVLGRMTINAGLGSSVSIAVVVASTAGVAALGAPGTAAVGTVGTAAVVGTVGTAAVGAAGAAAVGSAGAVAAGVAGLTAVIPILAPVATAAGVVGTVYSALCTVSERHQLFGDYEKVMKPFTEVAAMVLASTESVDGIVENENVWQILDRIASCHCLQQLTQVKSKEERDVIWTQTFTKYPLKDISHDDRWYIVSVTQICCQLITMRQILTRQPPKVVITGQSQTGKSTLFQYLTKRDVEQFRSNTNFKTRMALQCLAFIESYEKSSNDRITGDPGIPLILLTILGIMMQLDKQIHC